MLGWLAAAGATVSAWFFFDRWRRLKTRLRLQKRGPLSFCTTIVVPRTGPIADPAPLITRRGDELEWLVLNERTSPERVGVVNIRPDRQIFVGRDEDRWADVPEEGRRRITDTIAKDAQPGAYSYEISLGGKVVVHSPEIIIRPMGG